MLRISVPFSQDFSASRRRLSGVICIINISAELKVTLGVHKNFTLFKINSYRCKIADGKGRLIIKHLAVWAVHLNVNVLVPIFVGIFNFEVVVTIIFNREF